MKMLITILLLAQTAVGAPATPEMPTTAPAADTEQAVIAFAEKTILQTANYAYPHEVEDIQKTAHAFTPAAWQTFALMIESSGNLKQVQDDRMTVSGELEGKTQLAHAHEPNEWQASLPLHVHYQGRTIQANQHLQVKLTIDETEGAYQITAIEEHLDNKLGQNASFTVPPCPLKEKHASLK